MKGKNKKGIKNKEFWSLRVLGFNFSTLQHSTLKLNTTIQSKSMYFPLIYSLVCQYLKNLMGPFGGCRALYIYRENEL